MNLGITADEVHETLLHVGVYAGFARVAKCDTRCTRGIRPQGNIAGRRRVVVEPAPTMSMRIVAPRRDRVLRGTQYRPGGPGNRCSGLARAARRALLHDDGRRKCRWSKDIADLHADYGFGEFGAGRARTAVRSYITVAVLQCSMKPTRCRFT